MATDGLIGTSVLLTFTSITCRASITPQRCTQKLRRLGLMHLYLNWMLLRWQYMKE
jgi:hypothetical protein